MKVLKTGIFYSLQEVWEQILAAQVFHLFWPRHGTLTKQKYHLSTVCLNGDQIQLSFSAPTASHLENALAPPASLFLSNAFPGNTTSCNIQRQAGMTLESSAYVEQGTPMKSLANNVHKCLAPLSFLSGYCPPPWDFCLQIYWLSFLTSEDSTLSQTTDFTFATL